MGSLYFPEHLTAKHVLQRNDHGAGLFRLHHAPAQQGISEALQKTFSLLITVASGTQLQYLSLVCATHTLF